MNAYDIADQIINGSIDTNFDEPEIDTKGLKAELEQEVEDEWEDQLFMEEAAKKIAAILAGNKKVNKSAKIVAPKAKKVDKTSKMDTARKLYNSTEDKSRKNMINLFTTRLGMSAAMASTYFYKVKGN